MKCIVERTQIITRGQVQDRFKLDLSDEQADAHFLGLVSQSVTALAPRVLEVMHQIRVAAR